MPADPEMPLLTPDTFINRELSTLAFQRRVLAQAQDPRLPLLERVKFLAILGNNLDEFYMVRVASIIQKLQVGIAKTRADGYGPGRMMADIRATVSDLFHQSRVAKREIMAELEKHGVFLVKMGQLTEKQRGIARVYFDTEVFPVLTPLAVDHARPFPFISNLSLNLGVYLDRNTHGTGEPHYEFVRVKVPVVVPRLVNLRQVFARYGSQTLDVEMFVWMEDLIADNLDLLFPGMTIVESHPFRILRNADIDYEHEMEDELLDVKALIEQGIRERKFGSVVRLSVPRDISKRMLNRLIDELDVDPERDVYSIDGALGSAALFELAALDRPDLKYPPHVPRLPVTLPQGRSIFDAIRQQDILLHLPYDSFSPVEDFFREAAQDPDVLAIKATLYRVGSNSPVVNALMAARDNDKQVTVLVELKARFDEENNLEWAQALDRKGVHVIYGVEELPVKTHAKVAMVVRREGGAVRRYVHLGTGNYNSNTARLYTDMGLFTCDPEIADDSTRLFNRLTGYAPATTYHRLLVAPEYLCSQVLALIDNEIAAAKAGHPARLIFKMNQLEEEVVVNKLYEASQAGVQVDLLVRGICCLRPGIPGVSDRIRVFSIVGRFLEHSRIYYFQNAPEDQQIYMGSADLMKRNLYNRVEVVFPVLAPRVRRMVLRILMTGLRDNIGSWELLPDETYARRCPAEGEPEIDSQAIFMEDSAGLDEVP